MSIRVLDGEGKEKGMLGREGVMTRIIIVGLYYQGGTGNRMPDL